MSIFERIYKAERAFVAVATAIMGVFVFLDVIHRVITRDRSPVELLVTGVISAFIIFLALRTRGTPSTTGAQVGAALVATVVIGALLKLFVVVMPNGLIWSQTLGLVLMLWIAVLGSSMAAHEHRHLSLDLGSKLWPAALLPKVQAVGNVVTSVFCLALAFLAVVSLRSHFDDWRVTDGEGGSFAAMPVMPKWVAFSILPVGLFVMAVRFAAQAVESWRGKVEEDDAMRMLGLEGDE